MARFPILRQGYRDTSATLLMLLITASMDKGSPGKLDVMASEITTHQVFTTGSTPPDHTTMFANRWDNPAMFSPMNQSRVPGATTMSSSGDANDSIKLVPPTSPTTRTDSENLDFAAAEKFQRSCAGNLHVIQTACESSKLSCRDRCGESQTSNTVATCACDENCLLYGDCCHDYEKNCEQRYPAPRPRSRVQMPLGECLPGGYRVIAMCPNGVALKTKSFLDDGEIVTDKISGLQYKNIDVYKCHKSFGDVNGVVQWSPMLNVSGMLEPSSLEAFLNHRGQGAFVGAGNEKESQPNNLASENSTSGGERDTQVNQNVDGNRAWHTLQDIIITYKPPLDKLSNDRIRYCVSEGFILGSCAKGEHCFRATIKNPSYFCSLITLPPKARLELFESSNDEKSSIKDSSPDILRPYPFGSSSNISSDSKNVSNSKYNKSRHVMLESFPGETSDGLATASNSHERVHGPTSISSRTLSTKPIHVDERNKMTSTSSTTSTWKAIDINEMLEGRPEINMIGKPPFSNWNYDAFSTPTSSLDAYPLDDYLDTAFFFACEFVPVPSAHHSTIQNTYRLSVSINSVHAHHLTHFSSHGSLQCYNRLLRDVEENADRNKNMTNEHYEKTFTTPKMPENVNQLVRRTPNIFGTWICSVFKCPVGRYLWSNTCLSPSMVTISMGLSKQSTDDKATMHLVQTINRAIDRYEQMTLADLGDRMLLSELNDEDNVELILHFAVEGIRSDETKRGPFLPLSNYIHIHVHRILGVNGAPKEIKLCYMYNIADLKETAKICDRISYRGKFSDVDSFTDTKNDLIRNDAETHVSTTPLHTGKSDGADEESLTSNDGGDRRVYTGIESCTGESFAGCGGSNASEAQFQEKNETSISSRGCPGQGLPSSIVFMILFLWPGFTLFFFLNQ